MAATLFIPGIKRVRYFSGQLLTAEALEAEQNYFRQRLRRLVRLMYPPGIVSGLKVTIEGGRELIIAPGVAVDGTGRELVVDDAVRMPLPRGTECWLVTVRHQERLVEPVPVVSESESKEYSRVEEGVEIQLAPAPNNRPRPAALSGDAFAADMICLARLRRTARGWTVIRPSARARERRHRPGTPGARGR